MQEQPLLASGECNQGQKPKKEGKITKIGKRVIKSKTYHDDWIKEIKELTKEIDHLKYFLDVVTIMFIIFRKLFIDKKKAPL